VYGRPPIVHEERQVTARRGVNCSLQHRQDRKREPVRLAVAPLVLRKGQVAAASVLLAKPNNVRTPLAGIHQGYEWSRSFEQPGGSLRGTQFAEAGATESVDVLLRLAAHFAQSRHRRLSARHCRAHRVGREHLAR
jgi:hypothetical protein